MMDNFNATILIESITETMRQRSDALDKENETNSMNNQLTAYKILIPSVGFVIIVANFFVVLSSGLILKRGVQPKCTYLLLGNVAMADLITGAGVILGSTLSKENTTHLYCTIGIGLIVSTTLASIYSVGLIAIDRYLYIVHGLKYSQWVHPTRARILICFTWVIGILFGFAPLMGWSGDTKNGKICWYTFAYPPELIILISVLGIIPIILVICLYSIVFTKALKKVIQLKNCDKLNAEVEPKLRISRGNQNSHNENDKGTTKSKSNNPNKWKAIKVVMLTTGSFVITWVPYFIVSMAYVFCEPKDSMNCHQLKYAIASPLAILGFVNSLLNPLIYAWWHNGFRNTVRLIFCRRQRSKPSVAVLISRPLQVVPSITSSHSSLSSGRLTSISEMPNE